MGLMDSIPGIVKSLYGALLTPSNPANKTYLILRDRGYDPKTAQSSTSSRQDEVVISPPTAAEEWEIDGTTVKFGDQSTTFPALGLSVIPVPDKTTLKIAGVEWKVVRVNPIYSAAGVAAAYRVYLRK